MDCNPAKKSFLMNFYSPFSFIQCKGFCWSDFLFHLNFTSSFKLLLYIKHKNVMNNYRIDSVHACSKSKIVFCMFFFMNPSRSTLNKYFHFIFDSIIVHFVHLTYSSLNVFGFVFALCKCVYLKTKSATCGK